MYYLFLSRDIEGIRYAILADSSDILMPAAEYSPSRALDCLASFSLSRLMSYGTMDAFTETQ